MANSTTRISVTESSVYRNIHRSNGPAGPLYKSMTDEERGHNGQENYDISDSKWNFLQRLLEIEKVHDRRRMERERLRKALEPLRGTGKDGSGDKNTSQGSDILSRWMHGQVLDDEPEETNIDEGDHGLLPLSSEATVQTDPDRGFSHSNVPVLPAIVEASGQTVTDRTSPVRNGESLISIQNLPNSTGRLSRIPSIQEEDGANIKPRRKRQLRLPPILLPRVYTVTPRPLQCREFLTPTKIRGPITDEEWEDLQDCRYIRHGVPRFALQVSSSNMSSLQL